MYKSENLIENLAENHKKNFFGHMPFQLSEKKFLTPKLQTQKGVYFEISLFGINHTTHYMNHSYSSIGNIR